MQIIPHICLCSLSDDFYVIENTNQCCEVCDVSELREMTPENVKKAFTIYQDRLDSMQKQITGL